MEMLILVFALVLRLNVCPLLLAFPRQQAKNEEENVRLKEWPSVWKMEEKLP